MKLPRFALLLAVAALTAGCSAPHFANVRNAPITAGEEKIERVFERNYELGTERRATVGEPVVKVKDYQIETSPAPPSFVSTAPITANWMMAGPAYFPAGTELRIVGITEHQGRSYSLAALPHAAYGQVPLLVDDEGDFRNLAVAKNGLIFETGGLGGVSYEPRAAHFTRGSATSTIRSAGFVNFEIVYSGATRDAINMLYREFTPADMARPAFSQQLTYDRSSSTVRFRDLAIRVIEATNEGLRYVVESDGLPSS